MRTNNGPTRLVLAMLLLAQLANAYALAPGRQRTGVQAFAVHCTAHAGQPSPLGGAPSTGNCCEQPAGCHCPQAPALQYLDALLSDVFANAVPPLRLRGPPLLLRTEELFRPPI
jgi:hypothetical protein